MSAVWKSEEASGALVTVETSNIVLAKTLARDAITNVVIGTFGIAHASLAIGKSIVFRSALSTLVSNDVGLARTLAAVLVTSVIP